MTNLGAIKAAFKVCVLVCLRLYSNIIFENIAKSRCLCFLLYVFTIYNHYGIGTAHTNRGVEKLAIHLTEPTFCDLWTKEDGKHFHYLVCIWLLHSSMLLPPNCVSTPFLGFGSSNTRNAYSCSKSAKTILQQKKEEKRHGS